jgi:hypothetical protein
LPAASSAPFAGGLPSREDNGVTSFISSIDPGVKGTVKQ